VRSCRSRSLTAELMTVAAMPRAASASTWSFISAMSGETTTVTPGKSTAGSW
jgi:hypothetical protein